jgi:uncharacterized phiE125 gp8 family phage protein
MDTPTMKSRSVSVANPATEPLSLSEAKKHLEIGQSDTTHDVEVQSLIVAARELWEHDTQALTVSRAVTEKLDGWPDECWRFYHRPVQSVTSVNYYDALNNSQLLSSSIYSLDAPNRRLLVAVDEDWPDIETRWDAVTVVYVAGETIVPEIAKSAMKLQLDVLFELRGMTKEKDACLRAYENLVIRYQRSSYP